MTWTAVLLGCVLVLWFTLTVWADVQEARRRAEWERHLEDLPGLDDEW